MDDDEIREVAALFLRLGLTAFGGPAAHIAMMEEEVVRRRRWMTSEAFVKLLGASSLVPGPTSTQLAMHIGRVRAGWRGLVTAGVAFIFPAFVLVLLCAYAYQEYGALPHVANVFYGVKPVVIAIVVQALWGLGKTLAATRDLLAIAVVAFGLALAGLGVLPVLVVAAGCAILLRLRKRPSTALDGAAIGVGAVALAGGGAVGRSAGGLTVFLKFLKVGAVIYGSGYVLLAFLREELVINGHWLTEAQILDGVAIGQLTPGPVFTTATFLGYLLAGPVGAGVATVGIFLPGFLYVAASGWILPRIERSPVARNGLAGANAAALALMAAATWELGRSAVVDLPTAGLALASAIILVRFKTNALWLLGAGALVGLAVH